MPIWTAAFSIINIKLLVGYLATTTFSVRKLVQELNPPFLPKTYVCHGPYFFESLMNALSDPLEDQQENRSWNKKLG